MTSITTIAILTFYARNEGAQWLSGRVLDLRPRGPKFEPHRRHCIVSLIKNMNSSLVLVQPRKTRPLITERLMMGHNESNQTNKTPEMRFQINLVIVKNRILTFVLLYY